jgi:hypothetical protein
MNNEDFRSSVTVKRICTTRRLACATNIKPWRLFDVDVLIGIFRDPATNDCKVFLAFCPWVVGIDESSSTRSKIVKSHVLDFSCHQIRSAFLVFMANQSD